MPVLLYCVADGSPSLNSQTGVAGSAVCRYEESGISVFFSESPSTGVWLRAPLRESAKEFHSIQQELFRAGAIIPFRFRTILDNRQQLCEHIRERENEYKALLQRFANFVQMDIALTHTNNAPASSGAEYLRQRSVSSRALEQFAETARHAVQPLTSDWRQRSLSNGLRCFALVERSRVKVFNDRMKAVSVPQEISARVSGPWPVAAFLDLKA